MQAKSLRFRMKDTNNKIILVLSQFIVANKTKNQYLVFLINRKVKKDNF